MQIVPALVMIAIWLAVSAAARKKNNASSKRGNAPHKPAFESRTEQKAPEKPANAAPTMPKFVSDAFFPLQEEGGEATAGKHTVQVSFAPGAHAHEETSMQGFEECPSVPSAKKPEKQPAPAAAAAPQTVPQPAFAFSKEEAVRAIVYAEIFTKPKALR